MRHIIEETEKEIDHILVWEDVSEVVRAARSGFRSGKMTDIFDDPFLIRENQARGRDSYDANRGRIVRLPITEADIKNAQYRLRLNQKSWLGRDDLQSWDDVVTAVKTPWGPAQELLAEMKAQVKRQEFAVPRMIRRRAAWGNSDGDFDYDRHCAGQEAFRTVRKRDMTGQQFVTLAVNVSYHCAMCSCVRCKVANVSAEDTMWAGCAALTAASILEEAGYSVEILVCNPGRNNLQPRIGASLRDRKNQHLTNAVWVKRADSLVDEAQLLAAISPWFFRTILFGLYCCVPGQTAQSLFGTVDRIQAKHVEKATQDERYIAIEGVGSRVAALKKIQEILKQFAEHPEDELAMPELSAEPVMGKSSSKRR